MMTERMKRFVHEYLACGIGVRAAVRAGYTEKGAHTRSVALLRNAEVRRRIEELRAGYEAATVMSSLEVKQRLTNIAREEIVNERGVVMREPNIRAMAELNKMRGEYQVVELRETNNRITIIEVVRGERGERGKLGVGEIKQIGGSGQVVEGEVVKDGGSGESVS